ncbi:MAG: glycoside hydrolase family 13 protein [Clostridia bacterium]|nr:glycoside hydrolase family 13 protein [Clostridia bacterium]
MKYSTISPPQRSQCGSVVFIHQNEDVISSAYDINEKIVINAFLPRNLGVISAKIIIYSENCADVVEVCDGEWLDMEGELDVYEFRPSTLSRVGIYFFSIEIKSAFGVLHSRGRIYELSFADSYSSPHLQLTLTDFRNTQPSAILGGVIYHVFVDRFNRGGDVPISKGARLITGEWERIPEYPEYPGAPMKNNTFYGGTLYGVIAKLDYISSLGVKAIYLSPIFSSVSNHKYDTADYMSVDEMFGGDQALLELIKEADKRGIKIILDGVFNHTGSDSVYFNKYGRYSTLGAYQSTDSEYYGWYDFKKHPDDYTAWWGIDILPRINPDNPSCADFFASEGGVVSKYRDMGIYGLRLDVVDELSDSFVAKIKKTLSRSAEAVLYGEVWEDASNKIAYGKRKHYYLGNQLDGVMNYPLRSGIIDYFTGRGKEKLEYALKEVTVNAPDRVMHAQMNLLGTHDTPRILTVLSGVNFEGRKNSELVELRLNGTERKEATKKLISAYTVLATLPGIPTVFYGDEAGLEGCGDPFNRMPYPWGKENKKLISHYKKLGRIRTEHSEAYTFGAFSLLCLTDKMLAFLRYSSRSAYVTVYNNSLADIRISAKGKLKSLINGKTFSAHTLSPYSADVFVLSREDSLHFEELK